MTLKNFVFWGRLHFQNLIYRLSSAQFFGRSVNTSSPILTAYSILSAPRRSCRVTSRRSCREDWASLSSDHSRRVAFSVRYVLNTWRIVQGLARRLRRHSHCNPSPAEQNRTEPNRTAWLLRSSSDAPFIPLQLSWQPASFCPLHVVLVASRRVALVVRTERRFRRITLVASCSLWGTH